MAITVKFIADVVNWLSGLDKSEQALDDNAAGLEELMAEAVKLGTQAGRTADQIAQDFSDAFGVPLDRAKRAVDEVLDKTDELADSAGDVGRDAARGLDEIGDAGSDAARGVGKVADAAGDANRDVSRLSDAAGEVGSSMSELGSIARDALSGDIGSAAESAVGALGGIAAAAGIGGAVGSSIVSAISGLVGAMIDELTKFAEMSSEVKEGVIRDFVELGDGLDQAAVDQRIKTILGGEDTRRQAQLLADLLGSDLPTALLVLAGDFDTAGVSAKEASDAIADAPGNVRIDDWEALKATMQGLNDGLAAGPELADAQASALTRVAVSAAETAVAAGDASKVIDDLGQTVYLLPDGKVVVIDAETGQAMTDIQTVDDYRLALKKQGVNVDDDQALNDLLNISNYKIPGKTATITTQVDDSSLRAWLSRPLNKQVFVNTTVQTNYVEKRTPQQ